LEGKRSIVLTIIILQHLYWSVHRSNSSQMRSSILLLALFTLLTACSPKLVTKEKAQSVTFRLAFGSCADQDKPQPLLDVATGLAPDVFIYLGDNIYGDSYTLDTLRAKYGRLAVKPEFQRLKTATSILATWDDHDFGWNDAGRQFPFKEESKEIFLDFWEVPTSNDRYSHPGIYGTEWLERNGRKVQIILLDTRTFRDHLIHREKSNTDYKNDYVPNQNPDSTFLGAEQWAWLAKELRKPADARIIASSNQFSHEYNGWESWTNVPHEQQRMVDLIGQADAKNVFFISGDVHWGEISRFPVAGRSPIYDVTSSGITQTWDIIEPNKYRVGKAIAQNNVGLIELRFSASGGTARLALIDITEKVVVEEVVPLTR
jgi:alkaline phosphatase D